VYRYQQTSDVFALQTLDGFENTFARDGLTYRHTARRRVLQIFERNEPFFIKQHQGVGVKEIIKNLCQGKWPIIDAHTEWRALTKLHALNIACPTPVGVASRGFNPATRRSLIITRAEPYSISLEYVWRDASTFSYVIRQRLIIAIAQTVRALHQAGVAHRDLYLCHLWLRLPRDNPTLEAALEKPQLLVMDLHRASCKKTFSRRARIKDVAALYFSVQALKLTYKERLRFLKHYFEQPLRTLSLHKKLLWSIANRTYHLIQRHLWETKDKAHYQKSERSLLKAIIASPDTFLEQADVVFKNDAASTVARISLGGRCFILKRYNLKTPIQRIKRLIGLNRSARACKNAWWLTQAGITTPRPLAYFTKTHQTFSPIHYLLTEYMPGTLASELYVHHTSCAASLPIINQRVTRCQNQLEAAGVAHGDWKATNVLIHQNTLVLLDTDGVKRYGASIQHKKDQIRWEKNWDSPHDIT